MSTTIQRIRYTHFAREFLSKQCFFAVVLMLLISNVSINAFVARKVHSGCELLTNKDWSTTQALILNEEITKIIHPDSKDAITLKSSEKVVLACPGSRLVVKPETEVVASCTRGTEIKVDKRELQFKSMKCKKLPVTSTRVVGRCLENSINGKKVEIGFKVGKHFVKIIEVCFDDSDLSTVYSLHEALPNSVGIQHGIHRSSFKDAGFYHGIKVAKLYSIKNQRKTISRILGSEELGRKYIQTDNVHFLARGHLTAKADFIYGAEQIGTFYYINVAPQWQVINAGNWATLEKNVRNYVAKTDLKASVYTLVHGVAELPNVDGKLQELYIYDKQSYDELINNKNDDDDDDDEEEEDIEDDDDNDNYDDSDDDDNSNDDTDGDDDDNTSDDDDSDDVNKNDEDEEVSNYTVNKSNKKYLIPVPKFYIKILYHEETKKGVAFVTVNNPYVKHFTDDYILCEDVCHKYPWLSWKAKNTDLGHSYCCSYEELKKSVKSLPNLPIEHLL